MVFSSVPVYLDPPNWNQLVQSSHQPGTGIGVGGGGAHQQLPPPVPPQPPHPEGAGTAGGSVRPASMADRARMAKVPLPEPALNCPRCDSTNTKFCYFNNYSLSQPRHFCKTCRRYWTRGGALRNVPVGGGCRRNNKRSKSGGGGGSSSKSPAAVAADRQATAAGTSSASGGATSAGGSAIPSNMPPQSQSQPQLPFMASLHHLADYGTANIGLNFGGMQPVDAVDHYQVGSSSSGGLETWRLHQQFPFFAGLEPPSPPAAVPQSVGLYPFDGEGAVDGLAAGVYAAQMHGKASTTSGLISRMASVKMEENNPHGLNLPRQYLGIPRNDRYWPGGGGGGGSSSGGGWTDLSGFNS